MDQSTIVTVDGAITGFMEAQKLINDTNKEQFVNMQTKMDRLLALLEKPKEVTPPTKKRRVEKEAVQGSSTTTPTPDIDMSLDDDQEEKLLASDEENDDDNLQAHIDDDDEERIDEDAEWNARTKDKVSSSEDIESMTDEQLEAVMGSKYADIGGQAAEKVGDPVKNTVAAVCKRTWGRALLDKDKKEELLKGLDVPSNCKGMIAPKLNLSIGIRLNENATTKDAANQAKQTGIIKSTIPLYYAMGDTDDVMELLDKQNALIKKSPNNLEEVKDMRRKMLSMNVKIKSLMNKQRDRLHKSVMVSNYNYTEISRRRKQDVCNALGDTFKPFASEAPTNKATSGTYLFDEETMKRMHTDLRKLPAKQKTYGASAKNGKYSDKSRRSGFQGQYNKRNQNQSNKNSQGSYRGNKQQWKGNKRN